MNSTNSITPDLSDSTIQFDGSTITIHDYYDAVALLQVAFDFFGVSKSNRRLIAYYERLSENRENPVSHYYELNQREIQQLITAIDQYWEADMASWRKYRKDLLRLINALGLTEESKVIQVYLKSSPLQKDGWTTENMKRLFVSLFIKLPDDQKDLFKQSGLLISQLSPEADEDESELLKAAGSESTAS